jgi:glycosyltransferase involved in cell wall biosynthesis
MKKVLLVSNKVMHYRVSVYNEFADLFRARGYEFSVIANELQKENPHPLKFDFKEIPFRFSLYRKEIRRLRPDVVIIFLHNKDRIGFPLMYWLRLKGIPILWWNKGANLDDVGNRIRLAVFHHLQTLADGIVLYSPNEIGFVKPRNRHKVTFANNAVNHRDFPAVAASKEEIRRELGLPFKKIALFVGRMEVDRGRKKPGHAIDIFRRITNPDYGLVLVGSGMTEDLRARMNPANTVYLGEVHDPENLGISRIFKAADVFLMPGHVGLGLNQAFFWGLPVLTEEGKQPPEVHNLVDGRNGFIVKENDVAALEEKLLFLFENDAERLRMGENARCDILENASIDRMFSGFFDNIKRLEDRRGPA